MTDVKHGWSSVGLPVVAADNDANWTVREAAGELEVDENDLRHLIRIAHLTPAGKRNNGSRRRHVRVYRAAALRALTDSVKGAGDATA